MQGFFLFKLFTEVCNLCLVGDAGKSLFSEKAVHALMFESRPRTQQRRGTFTLCKAVLGP